jgi:hypothetical protein
VREFVKASLLVARFRRDDRVRSAPDCLRPPTTNPGHYCAAVHQTNSGSRFDWPTLFVLAARAQSQTLDIVRTVHYG